MVDDDISKSGYTLEDFDADVRAWIKKHGDKIYLKKMSLPNWMKKEVEEQK